jgi:D-2-hydroxyglutarate dehydrogenase
MRLAKQSLGGALSAFEFLDRASLELVLRELTGTKDPLPHAKSPFYVVVEAAETETGGGRARDGPETNFHESSRKEKKRARAALAKARRRLAAFATDAKRRGFVTAFVVGANAKHASALWNLRERVSLALKRAGATYKYDLSLPTETMYDLVEALRARVRDVAAARNEGSDGNEKKKDPRAFFDYGSVSVMGYGHLGDGNLHLNVSSPGGYHAELLSLIEPFVYEWTAAAKGSVSAEHGVGAMKRDQLAYSKPSEAMEIMRGVKAMLDPKGILNPYKVLPARKTTPDHPRARL